MTINIKQLRHKLIRPILQAYDLWTPSAEELLLGTAAQESNCGEYIVQVGNGPALGLYQMEPPTFEDIFKLVVPKINSLDFDIPYTAGALVWDMRLSTIMCRLQYWRFEETLPKYNDIVGLAKYWKKYYNTVKGKGTVEEFVESYEYYIGEPDGNS